MKGFKAGLLCVLVLAFVTIGAACGDSGSEVTLEEYFQRFVTAQESFKLRGDEIGARLDEGLENASDEEAIALYRRFFDEAVPLTRELIDELEDLDPPAEAQEPHSRFVTAFEDLAEVFEEIAGQLGNIETEADVERLLSESDAQSAAMAGEEACSELQDIADENEFGVDLRCEE